MRIFITGIGGFVGPHLVRHARACGDEVAGTSFGEPSDRSTLEELEVTEVDLLDREALAAAVARGAPEAVVHLAGLSHVGDSWDHMAEYFRVNVLGTENLLDAVAEHAPGARVVIASSSEVYGPVPGAEQPIREDRPLRPSTPYALTKAAAERLALRRPDVPVVVVRSFNLLGPGQPSRFALPSFAARLAAVSRGETEPVLEVGNLAARRDFVHVADGAEAYHLLARKGEPGGVYNLASGRGVSIAEALSRLREVSGVRVRVKRDPERFRPLDLPLLCGDPSRLEALGWKPSRTLDDAVRDLWRVVAGED